MHECKISHLCFVDGPHDRPLPVPALRDVVKVVAANQARLLHILLSLIFLLFFLLSFSFFLFFFLSYSFFFLFFLLSFSFFLFFFLSYSFFFLFFFLSFSFFLFFFLSFFCHLSLCLCLFLRFSIAPSALFYCLCLTLCDSFTEVFSSNHVLLFFCSISLPPFLPFVLQFSVVLTDNGRVFTFGQNISNELGLGNSASSTSFVIPQQASFHGLSTLCWFSRLINLFYLL